MSYEELEQRVQAVEEGLALLQEQVNRPAQEASSPDGRRAVLTEDDLIDGVECDIVLNVPAKREYTVEAMVISVERGRQDLALSDAEWASLHLEEEDD